MTRRKRCGAKPPAFDHGSGDARIGLCASRRAFVGWREPVLPGVRLVRPSLHGFSLPLHHAACFALQRINGELRQAAQPQAGGLAGVVAAFVRLDDLRSNARHGRMGVHVPGWVLDGDPGNSGTPEREKEFNGFPAGNSPCCSRESSWFHLLMVADAGCWRVRRKLLLPPPVRS